jgi:hypothetical protein
MSVKNPIYLHNLKKILGIYLINFSRNVTAFQAKKKLGYLCSLAENLVGDCTRDVHCAS